MDPIKCHDCGAVGTPETMRWAAVDDQRRAAVCAEHAPRYMETEHVPDSGWFRLVDELPPTVADAGLYPMPKNADLRAAIDDGEVPCCESWGGNCDHVGETVVPYGSTVAVLRDGPCDECVMADAMRDAWEVWGARELEWAPELSPVDGSLYLRRVVVNETKETG